MPRCSAESVRGRAKRVTAPSSFTEIHSECASARGRARSIPLPRAQVGRVKTISDRYGQLGASSVRPANHHRVRQPMIVHRPSTKVSRAPSFHCRRSPEREKGKKFLAALFFFVRLLSRVEKLCGGGGGGGGGGEEERALSAAPPSRAVVEVR